MHDLVLRGGEVHDGLGSPSVTADVAVSAGRVVAIGPSVGPARRVIDVAGLAVAPGFVDPHCHSDMVPVLPEAQPFKLLQGVTTEVNGNCGFSYAPVRERDIDVMSGYAGAPVTAGSFADYLAAMEAAGPTNHMATLVGHSTLRMAVVGWEPEMTDKALDEMCALAAEAFEAGACGLSSGLIYPPGSFGDTDELVALAKVAHRYGRPYTTHLRDEGAGLSEALDEAIEIARRARVALQVSHCKTAGPRNHGRAEMILERLRAARASGLDVRGDVYPYLAGGTTLSALLPPSALEGGVEALRARLSGDLSALRAAAEDPVPLRGTGLWRDTTPDGVLITTHADPSVVGRTLASLPGDPFTTACALIAADPSATMVITMMSEPDVRTLLADPLLGIGSDNGVPTGLEHPRTWGCFPHFLGAYVRDAALVPLPEAVRKITSANAVPFALHGRGTLLPGSYADITCFDPATISHPGTYTTPDTPPTGIPYVLLEGVPVVVEGAFTGERKGRILR
ncbi:D-aminoacylase [Actinocorallia sp. A-T 12471]|uniref:N-acyl-D-amino-acid deacylase family protein n=1 Tax=Actinocorallia sp. A-T 12471 TaxID=3089813 RepID=UPI0029CDC993|nr:D-aminoacylase [Actinocorallia sp. A-T 12471]MDX6743587.1 D-aminoacylase [Actinocorallia sp. A-T 12471]